MNPERRRDPRVEHCHAIRYRPSGATGKPFEAWLDGVMTDLSAGGLRLTGTYPFETGDRVEVELLLPIRPDPFLFVGEVRWHKPVAADLSEYGMVFVEVSPEQQFELDGLVQFLRQRPTKS